MSFKFKVIFVMCFFTTVFLNTRSILYGNIEQIYLSANDVSLKNYGQFSYVDNFYLNPALLGDLNKIKIDLSFNDLYPNSGVGKFICYSGRFAYPLHNKVKMAVGYSRLDDVSGEEYVYNEDMINMTVGSFFGRIRLGASLNLSRINFEYESFGESYKNNRVIWKFGVIYELTKISDKLGGSRVSAAFISSKNYHISLSYLFSDLTGIGVVYEKNYTQNNFILDFSSSIILDYVILTGSVSIEEYAAGLILKLPYREDDNFLFLKYTYLYNINLLMSHYLTVELNF